MSVDAQIQPLLAQLNANPVDFSTIEPEQMRNLFKAMVALEVRGGPTTVGEVVDRTVPGLAGDVPVRIYRPDGDTAAPVLVYFHGGGWVIGDLDTVDGSARKLCAGAGIVVVSVDYRLAPEHPFPAATDDAWAALSWVAKHPAKVGGDVSRLAVGGDSAGGNIAALMAIKARDEDWPALRHQMLVYPATDFTMEHRSIDTNGEGYLLTKASMLWFADQYLGVEREHGDPKDPRVSPHFVDDLSGVAPAQVLTAEFDPLRDEGDAYAARLAEAGVRVDHVPHSGLIHGFFGMSAISPACEVAFDAAVDRLHSALHD